MATRASTFRTAASRGHGWRWALVGALIGSLATLTLFAPARWLASVLREQSAGRVVLINPRGTVWNGASGVVFASAFRESRQPDVDFGWNVAGIILGGLS